MISFDACFLDTLLLVNEADAVKYECFNFRRFDILGSTFGGQLSLSEAADAILGESGDNKNHGLGLGASNVPFDASPGAVAKNLLGKIAMRKASIFSVSSIGSFVEKKSCSSTEELYPNNGKSRSSLQKPFGLD